jgi:hypothetical protein
VWYFVPAKNIHVATISRPYGTLDVLVYLASCECEGTLDQVRARPLKLLCSRSFDGCNLKEKGVEESYHSYSSMRIVRCVSWPLNLTSHCSTPVFTLQQVRATYPGFFRLRQCLRTQGYMLTETNNMAT